MIDTLFSYLDEDCIGTKDCGRGYQAPRRDLFLSLRRLVMVIAIFAELAIAAQTVTNDVSRLNPTEVHAVIEVKTVEQLREALTSARSNHLKVSIAGKRHSQGGQTSIKGGIVLDMTAFNQILKLDRETKVITVESGVTWGQIQDYVNPFGLAVEVQQSSNIFTVGGSLGVNAHGRDPRFGPVIQTVKSIRLMNWAGVVLTLSRSQNPELFSLVIGGYGLFGIIIDVDLQLTDDDVYQKRCTSLDYHRYPGYFAANVANRPDVGLHYARPSIRHSDLLRTTVACTFTKTSERPSGIFKLKEETGVAINSTFLDLSRKSELGKDLRWYLQNTFADSSSTRLISRNNAMRPEVAFLQYNSPTDTDILQEYFVPLGQFVSYVDSVRDVLLRDHVNLLSVTIRYAPKDTESFLSYSSVDSFAFVMYINQELSEEGKRDAEKFTRDLIDAALRHGGTYYLPYQRYATSRQIREAYPQLDAFINKKTFYDPEELFDSSFFEAYRAH